MLFYLLFYENSSFFVPGVDLFLTISMFLGAIAFSVFAVALIYCIRYKVRRKSPVVGPVWRASRMS